LSFLRYFCSGAFMTVSFVHLRLHTEFSLVDGLVRVKPLAKAVAGLGMPAVAVTDQSNMCSLVKFYKTAMGAGMPPPPSRSAGPTSGSPAARKMARSAA